MKCYLNISSGEVAAFFDDEESLIGQKSDSIIDEVKENSSEFISFNAMNSRESFNVMADFAMGVEDNDIRAHLLRILNAPSPFKNFKLAIDRSIEYRQKWLDYKKGRYFDYVKSQIITQQDQG